MGLQCPDKWPEVNGTEDGNQACVLRLLAWMMPGKEADMETPEGLAWRTDKAGKRLALEVWGKRGQGDMGLHP